MKKVLIALFLLISISVVAQNNTTEPLPTVGDQTVQVVNAVFDKTTEVIQQLADALSVPAEHVYKVLVRQQVITGVSLIIGTFVFIIVFILLFRYGNKTDWEYDAVAVSCILIGLLLSVLISVTIFGGIPKLLNPEYGAIKDIISVF
jgi:hypothetical protein